MIEVLSFGLKVTEPATVLASLLSMTLFQPFTRKPVTDTLSFTAYPTRAPMW